MSKLGRHKRSAGLIGVPGFPARKGRQPKKPRRTKTVGLQRQCIACVKSRLSRWPVSLRRAFHHLEHHRGRPVRLGIDVDAVNTVC